MMCWMWLEFAANQTWKVFGSYTSLNGCLLREMFQEYLLSLLESEGRGEIACNKTSVYILIFLELGISSSQQGGAVLH